MPKGSAKANGTESNNRPLLRSAVQRFVLWNAWVHVEGPIQVEVAPFHWVKE
jgi:hypothetical protein